MLVAPDFIYFPIEYKKKIMAVDLRLISIKYFCSVIGSHKESVWSSVDQHQIISNWLGSTSDHQWSTSDQPIRVWSLDQPPINRSEVDLRLISNKYFCFVIGSHIESVWSSVDQHQEKQRKAVRSAEPRVFLVRWILLAKSSIFKHVQFLNKISIMVVVFPSD